MQSRFDVKSVLARSICSLVLAALLLGSGCAGARVRKVPEKGDDSMTGVRFYMPRPYLNVFKTFPVEAESFFMDGVVAPDGKTIRLNADLPPKASKLIEYGRAGADQIPLAIVFGPAEAAPPGAQGATEETPPDGQGETDARGDTDAPQAGVTSFDVKRELNSVGHFPLRDYFDLVYLPDFDEQYVLEPKGKFGSAKAKLTLGPGNTMLALGTEVDNRAIIGPLISVYDDLLKSGSTALKTAIGIPPIPGVTTPSAQGALEEEADAGTPLTVRVHVVRYAVPGIYPLLKPDELADWDSIYPEADGHRLVGGFVIRTFESLIVEQMTASETLAASLGEPDGKSTVGQSALKVADEEALKTLVNILLRNANLEVSSVDSVTPADYSGPLTNVEVTLSPIGDAEVSQAAREQATGVIENRFRSTRFEFK